jgi:hypothetical protein
MKKRIMLDCEFTGLKKDASLISIALIAETGESFYAELNDYNRITVDPWVRDNVIKHLRLHTDGDGGCYVRNGGKNYEVISDFVHVGYHLGKWLSQFETVEIWADVLAYDWMWFCELFGGAFCIPKNVYYIPFDLATAIAMRLRGVDPDISRVEFSGINNNTHNALDDAIVGMACLKKLGEVN